MKQGKAFLEAAYTLKQTANSLTFTVATMQFSAYSDDLANPIFKIPHFPLQRRTLITSKSSHLQRAVVVLTCEINSFQKPHADLSYPSCTCFTETQVFCGINPFFAGNMEP